MARFIKDRSQAHGKKPGELVYIGTAQEEKISIRLIDFNAKEIIEKEGPSLIEDFDLLGHERQSWLNVDCLYDLSIMEKLGKHFSLHSLMVADILNTGLRSKSEEFKDGVFFVIKMLRYDTQKKTIVAEQFSLVIMQDILLTFQEYPGDVFENVRTRLRTGKGRIRSEKTDYLAYSLIDAIVDNYISIVEMIGRKIEDLEEELLSDPRDNIMQDISQLKREIIYLRRTIRPAIEAVQTIIKSESNVISETLQPFLRDLNNNLLMVSDAIDTYREMLTEQMNAYNSIVSNRLNDIMKFLTVFSVIFIPLTFLAGIYGTNFDNIPELHFKYGYFMLWGVLILVAAIMLWIFKRNKWF
ncbi:MAG: magnesium/cobalt transporter CorA [Spirochaetaceae bacterium]|jgi:magnesium transporter|nr:magnesium/cobalt transporter CorA [Spirochaetaceae bacterium]